MGNPYLIMASFIVIAIFGLLGIFSLIDKRGLKVEFKFSHCLPTFTVDATRPIGISKKEVEKLVDEKVLDAISSHMSALETYKDNCAHYDDNTKMLIAHRLDDIYVPVVIDDKTMQQVLGLSIKMELLILNIENHYAQAAVSSEKLQEYLRSRYSRLLRIFNKFSNNLELNQQASYFVLRDWWDVVSPALISMVEQKQNINESVASVFNDECWNKRMNDELNELKEIHHILTETSVRTIIRGYFESELSTSAPGYLKS